MTLDNSWYTEQWADQAAAISLKIGDKLHDEQSQYQRIEIYETEGFGTLMTLDGLVMLTDRDNFIYHEMLTHPALFTHPCPKKVLIIGGGDCGTLYEVLKHSNVTEVQQVELDERVTRVAEIYFPELCQSNNDPRVQFHFTDGIAWLAQAESDSYDVILVDSTDPVGPAQGLFTQEFYRNCHNALTPQGIVAAQSESPLFHARLIREMQQAMRGAGFAHCATLQFPQCTYPSGWWSVTLGLKQGDTIWRQQDAERKAFETRYYNAAMHAAALAMPEFLRQDLQF